MHTVNVGLSVLLSYHLLLFGVGRLACYATLVDRLTSSSEMLHLVRRSLYGLPGKVLSTWLDGSFVLSFLELLDELSERSQFTRVD